MYRLFFIVSILLINCLATASNSEYDYNGDVLSKIHDFNNNPTDTLKDYTKTPKERDINDKNIKHLARIEVNKNEASVAVRDNFDKRASFNLTESELSKSAKIINNADDITRGIANEYSDCKVVKECTEEFNDDIQYCDSLMLVKKFKCERERVVDVVIPDSIQKTVRVELRVTSKFSGVFHYNLRTQKITYNQQGSSVSTNQDNDVNDISCDNFIFTKIAQGYLSNTFNYNVILGSSFNNDCNNPVLTISIDQGGNYQKYKYKTRGTYVTFKMSSQKEPVESDSLLGECLEINKRVKNGICKPIKDVCTGKKETRKINGIDVTRDCWRYKTVYSCGDESKIIADNCKLLENNNCVQVSSKCIEYKSGICVKQTSGYNCLSKRCSDDTNVICGDGNIKCIDGSCVEENKSNSSDFDESISKQSILGEAIKSIPKDITKDTEFMFAGKPMKCRNSGYGFSDCCKDDGWGHDTGLTQCSDEEKELAKKKEEKFVIYIGKYKVNEDDDNIFDRRRDKSYCVFDSKLARIIQQQGRVGQLGIGFGNVRHPNCSGISANQLSKIDFDKMNLSVAFTEVSSKKGEYNQDRISKGLEARIKDYYKDEKDDYA